MGPTRTATETRDGTGGQERPTGTPSNIFEFFLLSFSFSSFWLPLFLQSTPTGEAGWGMSDVGETTHRPCPPPEVGGATGMYSNCFYSRFLLILFFSGCFFSTEYDDRRGGMGRGQRRRDDVSFVPSSRSGGGGDGHVFRFFCPLFSSSLHLTVFIIRLFLFFTLINNR